MNVTAFLSYILLSAFTPGPNNIMSMTNAARVGFRRGFSFNLGVLIGFLIDMAACALLGRALVAVLPQVQPVMCWVGAGYILYLAYGVVRDKAADAPGGPEAGAGQAGGLLRGIVMQFVNVKVILYGLTAFSTFILPHTQAPGHLALAVVLLSATGFVATCCWALFGSLFQRLFEGHRRAVNIVMAVGLVYCAAGILA